MLGNVSFFKNETLSQHTAAVTACKFIADGSLLASSCKYTIIRMSYGKYIDVLRNLCSGG